MKTVRQRWDLANIKVIRRIKKMEMIEYLKKLYPRGTKLGTDQKSNLEDTFLLMKVKPKNTYFLLEVKSRMSAKQQARVELMSQEL